MKKNRFVTLYVVLTLLLIIGTSVRSTETLSGQTDMKTYLPAIHQTGDGSPDPNDSPPDPEDPPLDLIDLLDEKIESGEWTETEGLVNLLAPFAEEGDALAELAQSQDRLKLSGLMRRAITHMIVLGDTPESAEIQRLITLILPDTTHIDLYADPYPGDSSASARPLDPVAPHLTAEGSLSSTACKAAWKDSFNPVGSAGTTCFWSVSLVENETAVSIYFPRFDLGDSRFEYLNDTIVAAEAAIDRYDEYGEMPDIIVQFSPLSQFEGALASAVPLENKLIMDDSTCRVVIYGEGLTQSHAEFKQTIAHEFFHCYQFRHFGEQVYGEKTTVNGKETRKEVSSNDWWVEGTAEYFSNVVYPTFDYEYKWESTFRDDSINTSLIEMSYETFLFWQYWGNRFGDQAILDLLGRMPTAGGENEQRAALAAEANIGAHFHDFAKAYLDQQIRDTGGTIRMKDPLTVVNQTITVDPETGRNLKSSSFTTFVISRFRLIYPKAYVFDREEITPILLTSIRSVDATGGWTPFDGTVRACEEQKEEILLVTHSSSMERSPPFELNVNPGLKEKCGCFLDANLGNTFFDDDLMTFDTGSLPYSLQLQNGELGLNQDDAYVVNVRLLEPIAVGTEGRFVIPPSQLSVSQVNRFSGLNNVEGELVILEWDENGILGEISGTVSVFDSLFNFLGDQAFSAEFYAEESFRKGACRSD